MAHFIILERGRPERRFEFSDREIFLGRDTGCGLILPNVSVSRKHARVSRTDDGYDIENVSSKAALMVNGRASRRSALNTRDEIGIGKYTLLFFGDDLSPVDQLYEGRMHHEIPDYRVQASAVQDSTHQLSKAQINQMREMMRRQSRAVVVRDDDETARWKPGSEPLGFGKQQAVSIHGWLAGGTAAMLEWEGSGHMLRKKGLAKVRVNGKSIEERILRDGDEFSVGGSAFRYFFEG